MRAPDRLAGPARVAGNGSGIARPRFIGGRPDTELGTVVPRRFPWGQRGPETPGSGHAGGTIMDRIEDIDALRWKERA